MRSQRAGDYRARAAARRAGDARGDPARGRGTPRSAGRVRERRTGGGSDSHERLARSAHRGARARQRRGARHASSRRSGSAPREPGTRMVVTARRRRRHHRRRSSRIRGDRHRARHCSDDATLRAGDGWSPLPAGREPRPMLRRRRQPAVRARGPRRTHGSTRSLVPAARRSTSRSPRRRIVPAWPVAGHRRRNLGTLGEPRFGA